MKKEKITLFAVMAVLCTTFCLYLYMGISPVSIIFNLALGSVASYKAMFLQPIEHGGALKNDSKFVKIFYTMSLLALFSFMPNLAVKISVIILTVACFMTWLGLSRDVQSEFEIPYVIKSEKFFWIFSCATILLFEYFISNKIKLPDIGILYSMPLALIGGTLVFIWIYITGKNIKLFYKISKSLV